MHALNGWLTGLLVAQNGEENRGGEAPDTAGATEPVADAYQDVANAIFEAVHSRMPGSLTREFLGIQYWQYAAAFASLLLGVILRKVSDTIFERYIVPMLKKTPFRFDGLLAEAASKPIGVAFVILGLFGVFTFLNLQVEAADVQKFIFTLLKIAFAIDFLWFVFRCVDVLAVYLTRAATKTDSRLDDQIVPLIKKSLKVFVAILVFVMIVQNLGYSVGSLLAGLGIGGLAVAMAAQDTLANFFGGIVIFTDHPFRIGDWVKIGDVEGTVEQIGFRSTRVRTFPKTLVTIPNKFVADQVIENKSLMPVRRVFMTIGVTYETKAHQMEDLVADFRRILEGDEGVDQEFIVVRFTEFGDSSLNIVLYYFTRQIGYADHTEVLERVNLAVMRAVEARGLSIAFPTRTVYFEGKVAKEMTRMLPPGQADSSGDQPRSLPPGQGDADQQ